MKKVLIIRFSSLGDVVIGTSLVETLKDNFKEVKIYFLTKIEYKDVFLNNANVEKVFLYNGNNLKSLIKEIKLLNVDTIFDIHFNLRSILLSFILHGRVFHYTKGIIQRRLYVFFKKSIGKILTVQNKYLNCINKAGFSNFKKLDSKLYITDKEIEDAKQIINYDQNNTYIAINTGARWETKRWIVFKYRELISRLIDRKYKVILLGDKFDKEFNKEITDGLADSYSKLLINLTGTLNLRQLFSVISLCNKVVTTDSAVMHISQALSVPVIALFGPTVSSFGFWNPKSSDIKIESDVYCRPCSLHGSRKCPLDHFYCMEKISVEEVLSYINF